MKSRLFSVFSVLFVLLLSLHAESFAEGTSEQKQWMMEKQQGVREFRYRLKSLLERQELEDSLREGENSLQDFQNLEQWMARLQEQMTPEKRDQFLKMLQQFEERISKTLQQQQRLESLVTPQNSSQKKQKQIALSDLMKTLKAMIQANQFEEAQKLLNQVLSAFSQQQQQHQQALDQYYKEQLDPLLQALQELSNPLKESLKQESSIESELQTLQHLKESFQSKSHKLEKRQKKVTEAIQKMQSLLNDEFLPAMFSMKVPLSLLEQAQKSSQKAQKSLKKNQAKPSLQSAQKTRKHLKQFQAHVKGLQQQMKQMQKSGSKKGFSGRKRWGDKGIRPLKLETDFQANPVYREDIQKLNRKNQHEITPRQQQYLQELIR